MTFINAIQIYQYIDIIEVICRFSEKGKTLNRNKGIKAFPSL